MTLKTHILYKIYIYTQWMNEMQKPSKYVLLFLPALRVFVLELNTREPVEGGVAHCAGVSRVLTLAEEIFGVLFADAAVLAGVGVASVSHAAGVDDDVLVHNFLPHLPGCRGLILPIDHNPPHAPDEAGVTIEATANAVISTRSDLNNPVGQHPNLEIRIKGLGLDYFLKSSPYPRLEQPCFSAC